MEFQGTKELRDEIAELKTELKLRVQSLTLAGTVIENERDAAMDTIAELKAYIQLFEEAKGSEHCRKLKADAIEEMVKHFSSMADEYKEYNITLFEARMYADQLRNKAK